MVICFCAVYKSKVFSLWSIKTITRFTGILEETSPSPHHMPFGSHKTGSAPAFSRLTCTCADGTTSPQSYHLLAGWLMSIKTGIWGRGVCSKRVREAKKGGVCTAKGHGGGTAAAEPALRSPAEWWELAGVGQVANSSPGPCSDAALCVFRCRRKPVSK